MHVSSVIILFYFPALPQTQTERHQILLCYVFGIYGVWAERHVHAF